MRRVLIDKTTAKFVESSLRHQMADNSGSPNNEGSKSEISDDTIRDYVGYLRIVKTNLIQNSDNLQLFISTGILAGVFTIYISETGRAHSYFFVNSQNGELICVFFGAYVIGKILEYAIDRWAIARAESFFEKHLSGEATIRDYKKLKTADVASSWYTHVLNLVFVASCVALFLFVAELFSFSGQTQGGSDGTSEAAECRCSKDA